MTTIAIELNMAEVTFIRTLTKDGNFQTGVCTRARCVCVSAGVIIMMIIIIMISIIDFYSACVCVCVCMCVCVCDDTSLNSR